jgi:hypothetical protein
MKQTAQQIIIEAAKDAMEAAITAIEKETEWMQEAFFVIPRKEPFFWIDTEKEEIHVTGFKKWSESYGEDDYDIVITIEDVVNVNGWDQGISDAKKRANVLRKLADQIEATASEWKNNASD